MFCFLLPRYPCVSVGVVRWVECVVKEPSFFKLCSESTPIHLALLDEIVANHPLLHASVLKLLVELFESEQTELEILVQVRGFLFPAQIEELVDLIKKH